MPRGEPPAWTERDCEHDPIVAAALANPDGPLVYYGIEDPDRAASIRKGVYRCGQHRKVSVQVSWPYKGTMTSKTAQWPPDKTPQGDYQLTIRVFPKTRGRRHQVTTRGTDRQQWDYNPRRRDTDEEKAARRK